MTTRPVPRSGSALQGALWMLVLAILLSWLPIVGPLVAGFVGGRMVGYRGRAVGIALLPAILLAVLLWVIIAAFELPVLGAVAGVGVLLVIIVQELPLLAGAWFGGAESQKKPG